MNNSFLVVDKLNAIFKQCYSILTFKYNDIDFVIYYCSDDGINYTIFVSKVLIDSNNNYYLNDVSHEDKGYLSKFVYDFVINFPLNGSSEEFIYEYCKENGIALTDYINFNNDQCFCDNSIVANTSFNDVKRAINFYNLLYTSHTIFDKFVISVSSNVWDIPGTGSNNNTEYNLVNNSVGMNDSINGLGNMSYIRSDVNSAPNNIIEVNNNASTLPVQNTVINSSASFNNSGVNNSLNFNLSNNTEINSNFGFYQNDGSINMTSDNSPFVSNTYDNNLNFDIFSTKNEYDKANKENAILKEKNAGFASNKYIIIGTLCLVLAALVVFVSITIVKSL